MLPVDLFLPLLRPQAGLVNFRSLGVSELGYRWGSVAWTEYSESEASTPPAPSDTMALRPGLVLVHLST